MVDVIKGAEGLLFVGDAHLSSRKPSRRTDDYASAILDLLEQSVEIANANRLVMVMLGDLFHRPRELEESLKTRLLRILNRLWCRAIANVGNHDIQGTRLSDSDSLSVIAESGCLEVFPLSGPAKEFEFGGLRVGLGFTPHGQEIPREVGSLFPDAHDVVWVTHHDMAFDGLYPGGIEPFEIVGCGLAVNGHVHLTKDTVSVGRTTWFNPGAITRTSAAEALHNPSVWAFRPQRPPEEMQEPHYLRQEFDVFDMTGNFVGAATPAQVAAADGESLFAALLAEEAAASPVATDEGSLLREAIDERFTRDATPPEIRHIVMGYFHKALAA